MEYRLIRPEYDAAVADLVRRSLKAAQLDIPGTAYYDEALDHLSAYYDHPGRAYYVLLEQGRVIGGVGLAEYAERTGCCELQKLYLDAEYRGRRLGYDMMEFIERKARETGYRRIYLETHTTLEAAIHLYEICGYQRVPRPASAIHGTMNRFYLKELDAAC